MGLKTSDPDRSGWSPTTWNQLQFAFASGHTEGTDIWWPGGEQLARARRKSQQALSLVELPTQRAHRFQEPLEVNEIALLITLWSSNSAERRKSLQQPIAELVDRAGDEQQTGDH